MCTRAVSAVSAQQCRDDVRKCSDVVSSVIRGKPRRDDFKSCQERKDNDCDNCYCGPTERVHHRVLLNRPHPLGYVTIPYLYDWRFEDIPGHAGLHVTCV